jgi:hypothetical protein
MKKAPQIISVIFMSTILLPYSADKYIIYSRGSVVGIATAYEQDNSGIGARVLVASRLYTSPYSPNRFWVHTILYLPYLMGTGGVRACSCPLTFY